MCPAGFGAADQRPLGDCVRELALSSSGVARRASALIIAGSMASSRRRGFSQRSNNTNYS
jgi:hypothetical protein